MLGSGGVCPGHLVRCRLFQLNYICVCVCVFGQLESSSSLACLVCGLAVPKVYAFFGGDFMVLQPCFQGMALQDSNSQIYWRFAPSYYVRSKGIKHPLAAPHRGSYPMTMIAIL